LLPTSFRTKLRRAIALSLARALDRARFLPPVFTFLRSRKLRRKRFRTTKQQLLINSCENLFSEWKSIFSKSILKRNNTFTPSEHPKRVIGVPASALNHSRTLFTMMRTKALSFSGPIATTDKIGSVRKHVFVSIDRFVRLSRFKPLILFLVFLCAENVFRLRSKSSFFAKRSERCAKFRVVSSRTFHSFRVHSRVSFLSLFLFFNSQSREWKGIFNERVSFF
jgi:hypothetical protein